MVEVYAITLVLVVLVFLELLSQGRREKCFATNSIWNFIWFLFSVLIFSMAATRVGGSDWVNYESLFNTISDSKSFGESFSENRLIEPGYVALNHFVAWVGGSRRDVVYIESAITAFGIFLLLTRVPGGSIITAWISTLIFIGVMPVRQTVAIALAMILFTTVSNKKKFFAALVATSFHISAVPLLVTTILSGKRLGKYAILGVVLFAVVAVTLMAVLLQEKIELYGDDLNQLTELSSGTVIFGKIVTIGFISWIWYLSSKFEKYNVRPKILDCKILHIFTMIALAMAIYNPAFIRLTSIFEIVYVWIVAGNIFYIKNKKCRIFLFSLISVTIFVKLAKISLQFNEVYDVCFFCA